MSNHNKQPGKNSRRPNAGLSFFQRKKDSPVILSFMKDIPNTVTLLGLCSGVLGIYFALLGNYQAAIIAMLWAVLSDWYDGPIARRIPGRSKHGCLPSYYPVKLWKVQHMVLPRGPGYSRGGGHPTFLLRYLRG